MKRKISKKLCTFLVPLFSSLILGVHANAYASEEFKRDENLKHIEWLKNDLMKKYPKKKYTLNVPTHNWRDIIVRQWHQVILDGNPNVTSKDVILGTITTLTNNLSTQQTLSSLASSFSQADSETSSTTHSTGFSIGNEFKFDFLVGEDTISTQFHYNFEKNDSKTKTTTITYNIPQQNIILNPKQSVKVVARLNRAKISGNVKLLSSIFSMETGIARATANSSRIETAWGIYHGYDKEYLLPSIGIIEGRGIFEIDHGAELYIDIVDVATEKTITSVPTSISTSTIDPFNSNKTNAFKIATATVTNKVSVIDATQPFTSTITQ